MDIARWGRPKGVPMHLIWSLLVGLVVGAIAKVIMPGKDPGGLFVTMLLGVAGSIVAGLLGSALGIYRAGATGPGIIASIVGAVILLAGYRAIVGRRASCRGDPPRQRAGAGTRTRRSEHPPADAHGGEG